MDKTIALIISTMVVMTAGVVIISISSGALGDLDQRSEDIGNQGCEFQQQRALENPEYESQMSDKCKTQEYQQMKQERSVVQGAMSQLGG